jgi:hypothetical protein
MGTINYRRSDIITLGYNIDYKIEEGMNEEEKQIQDEDAYYNSKFILDNYKYNFEWFSIELKTGYYEGYYLDLDKNYYTENLDKEEKKEINKEINALEKLLIELVSNSEMNVCYPWWCTKWEDYENSIAKVKEAMKELRKAIE